jgi:hypothetical protein
LRLAYIILSIFVASGSHRLKAEVLCTYKMDKREYNGWTNYATWRVNLEIVDGTQWTKEDFVSDEVELTVYDLSEHIKNTVEQVVSGYGELDDNQSARFALDYANAFLDDVNYREIAEHMAENYPEWNIIAK